MNVNKKNVSQKKIPDVTFVNFVEEKPRTFKNTERDHFQLKRLKEIRMKR